MLIIPNLDKEGSLTLDAYSFDKQELDSVASAILNSGLAPEYAVIPRDRQGRQGRRYLVRRSDVPIFESYFSLRFQKTGFLKEKTVTLFTGKGPTYRCEEITVRGSGNCETILAKNDTDAEVVCALLANNNGWFGGVATPGQCRS